MASRSVTVVGELSIALDGYSAGPGQTEQRPFGDDGGDGWGSALHSWLGDPDAHEAEIDRMADYGAVVMGRNMFGPVRGPWDREWNGWWGEQPPFGVPVFVLTHHRRDRQPMRGGTTFHFVTEGPGAALERAREAAGAGGTVSILGGATTLNQYLEAGSVDELRLHIAPITLGAGTRLFDGVRPLVLEQVRARATASTTHVTYRVQRRQS